VEPLTFSTVADVTVERVIIDFMIHWQTNQATIGSAPEELYGMVLTTCPTDSNEELLTAAIPDPLTGDIDDTQKRMMHSRMFRGPATPQQANPPGAGALRYTFGTMGCSMRGTDYQYTAYNPVAFDGLINGGMPIDVGVRRKLGGDQALALSFSSSQGSEPAFTVTVDVYARALLRIGRK